MACHRKSVAGLRTPELMLMYALASRLWRAVRGGLRARRTDINPVFEPRTVRHFYGWRLPIALHGALP